MKNFIYLFAIMLSVFAISCSTEDVTTQNDEQNLVMEVQTPTAKGDQIADINAVRAGGATNICQIYGVGSGWAFSNGTYGVYMDGRVHYMSQLAVEQWCEAWQEVQRNIVQAGCEGTYSDGTYWQVWWNPDIGEWWITNSSGSYPISNALHNQYCHPNEKSPSTIEESLEFQGRTLGQAGCSGNFPDGTFFQVYKSADTGEWNICSGSPWTCTVIPAATANAHCNQK